VNDNRPFLLVRARPKPQTRPRFEQWFREVHLRDIARIPGFVRIRSGFTPSGTALGIYDFESNDVVQTTLSSSEAAYARGTWEQWGPDLDELLIEIFAVLFPLPIYESIC
jgi:hypothetical protein